MKFKLLLTLCLAAAAVLVTKVSMRAQDAPLNGYYGVIPWNGGTSSQAVTASQNVQAATIPLTSFTFTASKDNLSYTDVIVGQNPFQRGHSATTTKILLVPMVITIGANTYDSTAANNCGGSNGHTDIQNFMNSPILTPAIFDGVAGPGHASLVNGVNMGTGTISDMHRRAEFLKAIGGPTSAYHSNFQVTLAPTQTITAATTAGHSATIAGSPGNCNLLGGLEINFFDTYFSTTVLNAVGGDPSSFVIFLMHNVIFYINTTNNCCVLGYHGTLGNLQTYSPTDYDTTGDFGAGIVNVSVGAHEVDEWHDDPLGNNPTPLWGGIGQVGGCQNNWETGDPLTGTNFPAITMPNGVTYNPQELVFWSWFYSSNGDPNPPFFGQTAGGKFSTNGTFGGPSKVCPPGGTF